MPKEEENMLKNTLLQWCEQKFDPSLSGHCDPHCSNRDNCKGDCDKCLDQVIGILHLVAGLIIPSVRKALQL